MSAVYKRSAAWIRVIRDWCQGTRNVPSLRGGVLTCDRIRHMLHPHRVWLCCRQPLRHLIIQLVGAAVSADAHACCACTVAAVELSTNAACRHARAWVAAHKAIVLPSPPADSSLGVHAGRFQFSTTTTVSCGALPASCRSRKSLSSIGGAWDGSDAPPLHESLCARSFVASAIVLVPSCRTRCASRDWRRRVLCAEC